MVIKQHAANHEQHKHSKMRGGGGGWWLLPGCCRAAVGSSLLAAAALPTVAQLACSATSSCQLGIGANRPVARQQLRSSTLQLAHPAAFSALAQLARPVIRLRYCLQPAPSAGLPSCCRPISPAGASSRTAQTACGTRRPTAAGSGGSPAAPGGACPPAAGPAGLQRGGRRRRLVSLQAAARDGVTSAAGGALSIAPGVWTAAQGMPLPTPCKVHAGLPEQHATHQSIGTESARRLSNLPAGNQHSLPALVTHASNPPIRTERARPLSILPAAPQPTNLYRCSHPPIRTERARPLSKLVSSSMTCTKPATGGWVWGFGVGAGSRRCPAQPGASRSCRANCLSGPTR